jgi:sRNA-binding regulator protein Hfq
MTNQTKLILALQQVDNLTNLVEGNKYQQLLYGHLISLRVELQRQLSNYGKTTD